MSDFNNEVQVAKSKVDMTAYRAKVSARIETNQEKYEAIETSQELKIYLKTNQNELKVVQTSMDLNNLNYQVGFEVDKFQSDLWSHTFDLSHKIKDLE